MLSAQLARIAGRLRTAITDAGTALHTSMSKTVDDLRKVADNLVAADDRGARILDRTAPGPDTPQLFGMNPTTGRLHAFTPGQVRSVPITDPDGNVIGVNFPSKLRDNKSPMRFTREGLQAVSEEYYQVERTRSLWPPKGLLPVRPQWAFAGSSPAPWRNKDLVFTREHANGVGYTVQVRKKLIGKWGRWVPVQVNGETYGRILATNEHFKQAARNKPTASLVQMACAPASRSAAQDFATSLHSSGIGFDVYADKHINFTTYEGHEGFRIKQPDNNIAHHGSEVKFDESGNPAESPWQVYPAPRPPITPQD